jgi:hypothetical protein
MSQNVEIDEQNNQTSRDDQSKLGPRRSEALCSQAARERKCGQRAVRQTALHACALAVIREAA